MAEFFRRLQNLKCLAYGAAGYDAESNLHTGSHKSVQNLVSPEYVVPHEVVSPAQVPVLGVGVTVYPLPHVRHGKCSCSHTQYHGGNNNGCRAAGGRGQRYRYHHGGERGCGLYDSLQDAGAAFLEFFHQLVADLCIDALSVCRVIFRHGFCEFLQRRVFGSRPIRRVQLYKGRYNPGLFR